MMYRKRTALFDAMQLPRAYQNITPALHEWIATHGAEFMGSRTGAIVIHTAADESNVTAPSHHWVVFTDTDDMYLYNQADFDANYELVGQDP